MRLGRESLPVAQGQVPKEHNKGEFSARVAAPETTGWGGSQGTLSYFGSYVVGGVLEPAMLRGWEGSGRPPHCPFTLTGETLVSGDGSRHLLPLQAVVQPLGQEWVRIISGLLNPSDFCSPVPVLLHSECPTSLPQASTSVTFPHSTPPGWNCRHPVGCFLPALAWRRQAHCAQ